MSRRPTPLQQRILTTLGIWGGYGTASELAKELGRDLQLIREDLKGMRRREYQWVATDACESLWQVLPAGVRAAEDSVTRTWQGITLLALIVLGGLGWLLLERWVASIGGDVSTLTPVVGALGFVGFLAAIGEWLL